MIAYAIILCRAGFSNETITTMSQRSKRPVQVCDRSNDLCAYVGNPPPKEQWQNLENARVLIQSASGMRNAHMYQELQQKCDQLQNDRLEKDQIEKKLSEKCRALEDLVEEKDKELGELKSELDAMKTHLSGVESLKHSVSSEYTAFQQKMATVQAEYKQRIEVGTSEKNELTEKLRQKQLKIEQSNDDIKQLMAEIKGLRKQNQCLIEENCELKKARQDATEIGVLLLLALFFLIGFAVLSVGAYVYDFRVGSYSYERKEL